MTYAHVYWDGTHLLCELETCPTPDLEPGFYRGMQPTIMNYLHIDARGTNDDDRSDRDEQVLNERKSGFRGNANRLFSTLLISIIRVVAGLMVLCFFLVCLVSQLLQTIFLQFLRVRSLFARSVSRTTRRL